MYDENLYHSPTEPGQTLTLGDVCGLRVAKATDGPLSTPLGTRLLTGGAEWWEEPHFWDSPPPTPSVFGQGADFAIVFMLGKCGLVWGCLILVEVKNWHCAHR